MNIREDVKDRREREGVEDSRLLHALDHRTILNLCGGFAEGKRGGGREKEMAQIPKSGTLKAKYIIL